MKSYTDLEQSEKLAEILPPESADMEYLRIGKIVGGVPFVKDDSEVGDSAYSYTYDRIACWSLAALLEVLPNDEVTSTTVTRGGWNVEPARYLDIWFAEYETEKHDNDFSLTVDTALDTAFEMICRLKEKNLL